MKRALETLQASTLDEATKRQTAKFLEAMGDPESQKLVNIVKQLPPERQVIIEETAKDLRAINREVVNRGKARLMGLSAEDWDKLVESEDE